MNFLQSVQRLHSETMNSTAAPTTVVGATGRVLRLRNAYTDAWQELQSERDWEWMRGRTDAPLTIGLQTYTGTALGAARFGRWREETDTYCPTAYIAGSPNALWNLSYWNLDEFRRRWVYLDNGQSTPVAYTIDEVQNLLVGPAPAVAYQLRADYWKEPSTLTADVDEPDLPARFELLPMWRALMAIGTMDAAPEVVARAAASYGVMHNQLLSDQGRRPTL